MNLPAVVGRLSDTDVEQVRTLIDDVQTEDGTPPLSEHVMLHLPRGGDADVRHLLVRDGDVLMGYAHLDVTDQVAGSSAEFAVRPDQRGKGVGRALVEELLRQTPDGRLRLWAHGEHPAAAALAHSLGFQRTRSLWQMRRPLDVPLPAVVLPEGVEIRAFVPGQDEQAWTDLNNKAFAAHPDQGGWGLDEVLMRETESWFDPQGFFLAEREGQLVGFHWTKVHGAHADHDHDHDAVGEVYIVGVDPSQQGRGLGPALTLLGLHHLRDSGLQEVLLYVDEGNTNAIRVYERLGFSRHATDACFARNSATPGL